MIVTAVIAEEFGEPLPEWVKIQNPEPTAQRLLESTLDPGEASAIALSLQIEDPLLVIDDLKGRKEAKRLGLKITGTLGVLYKAKEIGVIPELAPLLDKVVESGFRIAPDIIDELRRRAGESTSTRVRPLR